MLSSRKHKSSGKVTAQKTITSGEKKTLGYIILPLMILPKESEGIQDAAADSGKFIEFG